MWTRSLPAARPPTSRPHSDSDGGSAGTAWPTCRRCRCLPGDERGNPHLGENTDFKDDRVGRSLAISNATAELIIEHKQHVRERFPDTALADLVLP